MLGRTAIFADDTGQRVISVDYTLAPEAKFGQMSDEVVAVTHSLVEEGHAVGSSRVDLQACKLEYSIVSPK